jgi:small subunit ribosomal protein S19
MSRAIWKGAFVNPTFFKKSTSLIWSRSSAIPASLLGHTVSVHNGKEFKLILITREKIGFKFGAFVLTRSFTNKYNNFKKAKKKNK